MAIYFTSSVEDGEWCRVLLKDARRCPKSFFSRCPQRGIMAAP